MIELNYFRRKGHAQHDPQDYVDPVVIRAWEKKDPLDLYRSRLLHNEWASEEELMVIEEQTFEECRVAAEAAIAEPYPEGSEAVLGVYTDVAMPHPWTRSNSPDPTLA